MARAAQPPDTELKRYTVRKDLNSRYVFEGKLLIDVPGLHGSHARIYKTKQGVFISELIGQRSTNSWEGQTVNTQEAKANKDSYLYRAISWFNDPRLVTLLHEKLQSWDDELVS